MNLLQQKNSKGLINFQKKPTISNNKNTFEREKYLSEVFLLNYEIYKNSRDAAWRFLIRHNVRSLLVDVKSITAEMGIIVRQDVSGVLKLGERCKTINANGQLLIIAGDSPVPQTRYTIRTKSVISFWDIKV